MGHSERLKLGEVRSVFRLIGEVRELGDDTMVWEQHLVDQAARLFGARIASVGESILRLPDWFDPQGRSKPFRGTTLRNPAPPARRDAAAGTIELSFNIPWLTMVGGATTGWDDEEQVFFVGYIMNRDWSAMPHMPPYLKQVYERDSVCRSRRQLTDDRTWYRWFAEIDVRSGTDQDDHLLSARWIPGLDGQFNISLFRAWGDRPFSDSQRRLLRLLDEELGRLWEPDPGRVDPFGGMAPRWRQTLEHLMAGASEKQIATRLGVSRHTVHTYVKALHRHFGVATRGELLAHCRRIARVDGFHPRLVLPTIQQK